MNAVTVFTRVFSHEFYRLNSGFFLVVFGLCFGFMRLAEHLALAHFFVSSSTTLLIPFSAWLFYTTKVTLFNQQAMQKTENEFCHYAWLLPRKSRFMATITVAFYQLLPVTLYGIFLLLISLRQDRYFTMALILSVLALLHMIVAFLLHNHLRSPKKEKGTTRLKVWLDRQWSKPFAQIALEWLARKEPGSLLGTKVLSYAVLWGAIKLHQVEGLHDIRLIAWGITIAFTANIVLLYHYHQFENFHFSIYRNLPFRYSKRALHFFTVFAILCLPEAGLLLTRLPRVGFSLLTAATCILYAASIQVLLYGLLYTRHQSLENTVRQCFFVFILLFVLVLFNTPLVALGACLLMTGLFLWIRNYYAYGL